MCPVAASIRFKLKNAVVAFEEAPIIKKVSSSSDEIYEAERNKFPFDYHEIRNCDLNRQTIMINLHLQDNTSMKHLVMNVIIEHRP